jgi:hypothetical protein
MAEESEFDSRQAQEICHLSTESRLVVGPKEPPTNIK